MVDVSLAEDASNGYQGKPNQQQPEPEWRCAKFRCSEGGLLAFEEWSEQQKMGGLIPDFNQQGDRGTTGGVTTQSTLISKNITQTQGFEGSDQGDQGDQGTTSLTNERVGDVPNQQDTPPQKIGEELASTPIYPARSLSIDEWVSQLSEVANRDGTTYEAVKGLGVPNHQRPEIFAALTPSVKERLKGLREEFERRIPQDIEKWREAIAAWSVLDADALNHQWQQFDLWSQCLLGIGNWVERINKSGLLDLGASVYAQALELATEKSEVLGDVAITNVEIEITNPEPKQLTLLPDLESPSASENRFAPESEDWF
jgi:hypothetical protein